MNSIIRNVKKTSFFIFAISILGVALSLQGCGDDDAVGPDMACADGMLELPIDFDCEGINYDTKIVGDVVIPCCVPARTGAGLGTGTPSRSR